MTTRSVKTLGDLEKLVTYLRHRKLPFTVTVETGRKRTTEQNRLQRLWVSEIAEQTGSTPEEVRGLCKLQFGVPILRAEDEAFRIAYDANVRPRPYSEKLALMMEPLDLPVTRLMNVDQKRRYLDAIHAHFAAMGIALTDPDPLYGSAA